MGCVFMRGVLAKRPPVITLLHHPPRQPYNSSLLSDTPSILLFLALLFSVSLFLSLSLPLSDTHIYTHTDTTPHPRKNICSDIFFASSHLCFSRGLSLSPHRPSFPSSTNPSLH